MRLLVAHPVPGTPSGLETILLWAAQAGHTVQRVSTDAMDAGFVAWASALIAREAPDLVWAHASGQAEAAVLAQARNGDVPTLLTLHDDPGDPAPFAAADRIIVPSAWLAARLR